MENQNNSETISKLLYILKKITDNHCRLFFYQDSKSKLYRSIFYWF